MFQATVKKLVAMINKATGEPMPKGKGSKPRCLVKNSNAVVEIVTEQPICLELYSNIKELGRFMLRSGLYYFRAVSVSSFVIS